MIHAFALACSFALIVAASDVYAADLRTDTLDAFNQYVALTESRMDGELHGKSSFLWIDRLPDSEREETHRRLERGDFVISRLETRNAGREIDVPHGLIHHWIGTILIPGASVDRVVTLMQDYERYQTLYAPNVRQSRTIARDGDHFTVSLQLFMKKVISVVLNTDNDVRYVRLASTRAHVRSFTTRITELQGAGSNSEAELPAGRDSGFLWRFNNYCSLEERGEGTFVQCESISLSRGIPTGLGWIVGPFVTSIPRESLEFTLGHMRSALVAGR
jgi:hypothetical protein